MRAYLTILRIPGALAFSSAGLLARIGSAMVGIGTLWMASMLYGNYGVAGALTAANAVSWAIGTAVLGHLVDRHGQRRIMLPAAMVSAACLVVMVILALIHAPLVLLFAFTIVSGLTGGSPGALVRARWNYVLTSTRDLHTAYSLESTFDEVCFVVGPILATWLATSVHPTAGLVAPAVLGAVGALIFYSLRASEPKLLPHDTSTGKGGRFMLSFPGVASVIGVGLLMGSIFGSIDVTTVAATTAWDVPKLAGLILGAMSLGSGIGGLLYGSRGWTSPLWKRFALGVCLLGIMVCSLFFAVSALILGVCGFVAGFSIAPTFINANGLIGRLIPPERLTEGLAWLGTAIGIGVSIGSTIAGHVIDQFSYHGGFICAAAAGLLACVLALISIPVLKTSLAATGEVDLPQEPAT
ncbi:MAG: MFS transporter [Propionibacteriaceae bacterium]|nr:MFS transporter [Propionibacteriaceae bacterium]